MKKQEADLSEFEIFEKGHYGKVSKYKDLEAILISRVSSIVYPPACKKISLQENSRIAFSMRNGLPYVAVLPLNSKIKGYSRQSRTHKRMAGFAFGTVSAVKKGLPMGAFMVKKPIYAGGIDWFALEKIE